jgi:hypothetical protein
MKNGTIARHYYQRILDGGIPHYGISGGGMGLSERQKSTANLHYNNQNNSNEETTKYIQTLEDRSEELLREISGEILGSRPIDFTKYGRRLSSITIESRAKGYDEESIGELKKKYYNLKLVAINLGLSNGNPNGTRKGSFDIK